MTRPSDTVIRRHAHRIAADALTAARGMWDLHRLYPDPDDRDRLEGELLTIIGRLREHGGEPAPAAETNGWPGDEHAEPGTRGWTV